MKNLILDLIGNKKTTVLGFGVSNIPLVEFLIKNGADVTVRDKKRREELGERADEFETRGVRFITGEKYLSDICEDVVFRSPGIRPDLPEIAAAVARGAVLTSEMELFLELTPATVIGVTGSDGKTTTTTLTHLFLKTELEKSGEGRAYIGGNIGTPLLQYVDGMTERDFAVVELSSFQLQTMRRSPNRSVITNITPNHLNWHTGMDEYTEAKCNIYRHTPASMLVLNRENDVTFDLSFEADLPITYFSSKKQSYGEIVPAEKNGASAIFERDGEIIVSDGKNEEKIIDTSDILLPGRHNVENYMAAIALTRGLVSPETVQQIAREFKGVDHRLEFVRELDGVRYYNSSIDSSPTRTAAALSALPKKPIVICGGYDKNIPFEPLAESLCEMAKAVVLTGATARKIEKALLECRDYSPENLPTFIECDSADGKENFVSAIERARSLAAKGDIVLLSPACASFDAFRNFEERGKYFKDTVNKF